MSLVLGLAKNLFGQRWIFSAFSARTLIDRQPVLDRKLDEILWKHYDLAINSMEIPIPILTALTVITAVLSSWALISGTVLLPAFLSDSLLALILLTTAFAWFEHIFTKKPIGIINKPRRSIGDLVIPVAILIGSL